MGGAVDDCPGTDGLNEIPFGVGAWVTWVLEGSANAPRWARMQSRVAGSICFRSMAVTPPWSFLCTSPMSAGGMMRDSTVATSTTVTIGYEIERDGWPVEENTGGSVLAA